jgi:hypothetical protein
MNSKRRSLLIQAASVAAPSLLIVSMRFVLVGGPDMASAAGSGQVMSAVASPAPDAVVQPAARQLSPEQQRANDWRANFRFDAMFESPMDARANVVLMAPKKVEPVAPAKTTPSTTPPKTSPVQGLALTSFMGNLSGGLVVISGKVYRVGEEVRPGLLLANIDFRNATVTLQNLDGESFTLVKKE